MSVFVALRKTLVSKDPLVSVLVRRTSRKEIFPSSSMCIIPERRPARIYFQITTYVNTKYIRAGLLFGI